MTTGKAHCQRDRTNGGLHRRFRGVSDHTKQPFLRSQFGFQQADKYTYHAEYQSAKDDQNGRHTGCQGIFNIHCCTDQDEQAGFSPIAHVEMNPYAAQTLETRTGYYYLKEQGKLDIYFDYIKGKISRDKYLESIPEELLKSVCCETMSDETLPGLFDTIDSILTEKGIEKVDVIIGGPPCQAYSLVGRAQSSHMETPMATDPRNDLYKLYAKFLKKYQPKMFVFENVMGILSANGGATWVKVQEALRAVGYEIECHEQNSKNFGVLQSRRRMIIVGWLKDSGLSYPQFEKKAANATVNDILLDLPALHPGEQASEYTSVEASEYLKETGIRKESDVLTR